MQTEPQAKTQPEFDGLRQLEEAIRSLEVQIAKIEVRVRTALEQVTTLDVSIA